MAVRAEHELVVRGAADRQPGKDAERRLDHGHRRALPPAPLAVPLDLAPHAARPNALTWDLAPSGRSRTPAATAAAGPGAAPGARRTRLVAPLVAALVALLVASLVAADLSAKRAEPQVSTRIGGTADADYFPGDPSRIPGGSPGPVPPGPSRAASGGARRPRSRRISSQLTAPGERRAFPGKRPVSLTASRGPRPSPRGPPTGALSRARPARALEPPNHPGRGGDDEELPAASRTARRITGRSNPGHRRVGTRPGPYVRVTCACGAWPPAGTRRLD